ncbi:hypothetical protein BB987_15895 [Photorhabdus temperata]|uniref:Uncharacterized protein n=1 Tax=Photorhabdus khanii subsp. guanajuatensis TaxID=2100166 RepID=A0A4R4K5E5_9GAMM|nr:hypothetical protein BB987_15895 [Photorhabdus temperata]TDB62658.1 hypothetical protein C5467_02725 [Photorhabdus khanii subsp. guanajuatensis]
MLHILTIIPDILSNNATKTTGICAVVFMIHDIFMQFTLIYYKYRVSYLIDILFKSFDYFQ